MTKLYRFALVGLAGSGKTCIVAALTVPRIPNPEGYSATWVQHPPEANSDDEAIRKPFADGDRVLREARDQLKQRLPPHKTIDPTMCFRFHFQVKEGRTYATDLIDYPGEWLDPDLKDNQWADKLRKIISECDGLFVLAEAPRPGSDDRSRLHDVSVQLDQGMARLDAPRRPRKPVVLLLNKWDRREAECGNTATRQQQVQAFLDEKPAPPQWTLINALQGSVAPDCFHILAVSAFGASRRQTDEEFPPDVVPLPSFGLEDGFIWAARKCDAIEMEPYRQQAQAHWRPWLPWPPRAVNRVREQGRHLAQRFPAHSSEHQEIAAEQKRLGRIVVARASSFVGLLLLTLLLALGAMMQYLDVHRIRDVEAHLNSPDARDEELAADVDWLQGYIRSPGPRHYVSKWLQDDNRIGGLLARANDRREDLAMVPIRASTDPLVQEPHAKIYLERFPNGKSITEVTGILVQADTTRKDNTNLAHLKTIEDELHVFDTKPVLTEQDLQKLEHFSSSIEKLPYPELLSAQATAQKEALRIQVRAAMIRVGDVVFDTRLQQHLSDGKLAAALLLIQRTLPESRRREVGAQKVWLSSAAAFTTSLLKEHWDKCRELLKEMHQGFVVPGLASKEQIILLQDWKSQALLGEDRSLYEEVRTYHNQNCCKVYLNKAPLLNMKTEVQAYLDYLHALQEPLEVTYVFHKFHMGERPSTIYRLHTRLDIYRNEAKVSGYFTPEKFKANATHDKELHRQNFIAKLSDSAKVTFKMERGGIIDVDSMGEKEWSGPVSEMKQLRLDVPIPGGNSHSEVYIRLEGIPEPPPLPPHRKN